MEFDVLTFGAMIFITNWLITLNSIQSIANDFDVLRGVIKEASIFEKGQK